MATKKKGASEHRNLVRVKGADALHRVTSQLEKQGFIPAPMPDDFGSHSIDNPMKDDWGNYLHSELMARTKGSSSSFPVLHLSSGQEIMPNKEVGTQGLGYMSWGEMNNNPNVITHLTEASPYPASANRFNTDLCCGRGPRPVYSYVQYVAGNITEKRIPYSAAGVLIKGWLRDLKRELAKIELEEPMPRILPDDPDADDNSTSLANDIREQIKTLQGEYKKWQETDAELKEFMVRNNLPLIYLSLTEDMQQQNICFPEITLNQRQLDDDGKNVPTSQWRPKITGLRYRMAHICRLERKDKNGRINYVYISNQWLNQNGNLKPEDLKIDALPALDPYSPVYDLQRHIRETRSENGSIRNRPTRFILPVSYPSAGRPYYPVPANTSIYSGDIYEYLMTMISDRNRRRRNSNVIGRIIYLNQEYMERLYFQRKADTDKLKTEVFNELRKQINSFLADRDNAGKPLVAYTFIGSDGKVYESWKIVEIEANDKGSVEANQKELAEVSSIIFFAFGLDSRLVGNSPGDVSSSGGTDLRERYMLKQLQMSPMQQLLLTPLYVVKAFNELDPHLEWEIPREVLTTLDNSKTGITTQPQSGQN